MFENVRNTVGQGAVGFSAAIFYYQKNGYNCCIPLVDNQNYDLVIEKNGELLTVQVKSTRQIVAGNYVAELKSVRPNKNTNNVKSLQPCDLLFVLCENGDCYSVPFENLTSKNQFRVSKYQKYKESLCQ